MGVFMYNKDGEKLYGVFVNDINKGDYIIPLTEETLNKGFQGNQLVVEVRFPDTIKKIPWCAFMDCDYLVGVELSSSIETIGESAFECCLSLEEIEIPEGVKVIEERAFEGCCKAETLALPTSLTKIGKYAFLGCNNLQCFKFNGIEYNNPVAFVKALKDYGICVDGDIR